MVERDAEGVVWDGWGSSALGSGGGGVRMMELPG